MRASRGAMDGGQVVVLLGLLGFAAALRIIVWQLYPSIHWPDEVMQATEQGHRLVFGYGVKPWEWFIGIRSWFLPGLLAGPQYLAAWFDAGPDLYLPLIHGGLALVSLTVPFVAFRLGGREDGMAFALVAAAPSALWFELVYFAPRALTEVVAAHLMILGLYLLMTHADRPWRLFSAGLLLGVAAMTRPQIGPAMLVGSLIAIGWPRWTWLPFIGGALVGLLTLGLLDWGTWDYPFQSAWLHFRIALVDGRFYGGDSPPWNLFISEIIRHWGGALAILLLLVGLGTRGYVPLLAVAVVHIAVHSSLPYKEFRYIYPALPCLMILAGIGLARAIVLARRHIPPEGVRIAWLATAVSSAALAVQPGFSDEWRRGAAVMEAYDALSRHPKLCGVALIDNPISTTPGFSHLHRRVPLYEGTAADLPTLSGYADALVTPLKSVPGYDLLRCWESPGTALGPERNCVHVRSGDCAPGPDPGWGMHPPAR